MRKWKKYDGKKIKKNAEGQPKKKTKEPKKLEATRKAEKNPEKKLSKKM